MDGVRKRGRLPFLGGMGKPGHEKTRNPNPREFPMRAYIFPGQGSQAVGMGRDLYDAFAVAREVFEEVDEALKEKLSALIFEGPAEPDRKSVV